VSRDYPSADSGVVPQLPSTQRSQRTQRFGITGVWLEAVDNRVDTITQVHDVTEGDFNALIDERQPDLVLDMQTRRRQLVQQARVMGVSRHPGPRAVCTFRAAPITAWLA
jgi:hypothetical protein